MMWWGGGGGCAEGLGRVDELNIGLHPCQVGGRVPAVLFKFQLILKALLAEKAGQQVRIQKMNDPLVQI